MELIGSAEVADVLGVEMVTVWRYVKEGKLTPIKRVGRAGYMLFDQAEIEEKRGELPGKAGRPKKAA